MLEIAVVQPGKLARIAGFYEAAGYGGGVSAADLTFAADLDGRLAGAVRLCEEHGDIVLRGMQVAQSFQRQGIGRALLARCIPWLDRGTAWCLPYEHLTGFYGEAGFEPAPEDALPPFLSERLARYLASGQRVLAMRRSASA
ncbi:GNAT family N-acetyltransferase [Massilia sp. 2TAF26]|uniref:GNAT family N-acetyltransferase n=1 Tax=Massilia sp. 2TAF26 TaxID=3233012 RepID=UPI003F9E832F